MILISVIIPCFNVEEYIGECLDSIFVNQKLDNINFEIICVDDGSTDDTKKILDYYKNRYDQITVYLKNNGGLSDARNFGISKASGSYLTFVDSDDIVANNYIYDLNKELILNSNVDILSFGVKKFFHSEELSIKKNTDMKFLPVDKEFYSYASTIACNKVYSKKLFNNIKFPVGKYFEDVWTVPFLINKAREFRHSDNEYYFYRQRIGSITSSVGRKYLDIYDAVIYMEESADKNIFIVNKIFDQYFTLFLLCLRSDRLETKNDLRKITSSYIKFSFSNKPENYSNIFIKSIYYSRKILGKNMYYALCFFKPLVLLQVFLKKYKVKVKNK